MTTTRKQYSPQFKGAGRDRSNPRRKALSQMGSQSKAIQIAKWRKSALEQLTELFVDGRKRRGQQSESNNDALYKEIGRLGGRKFLLAGLGSSRVKGATFSSARSLRTRRR